MADGPKRRRRLARGALLGVTLVGLLFVFVYPTRTFLDQRNETKQAQSQLALLERERAELQRQAKALSKDSDVIRIARERYGLVKPGEQAFLVLPAAPTAPPATTTTTPRKAAKALP